MLITQGKFDKALEIISQAEIVAIDTETFWTKSWENKRIIGVSVYGEVGNKHFNGYFPYRHECEDGDNLALDSLEQLFKTLNAIKVHKYHGAKFDRSRFLREGFLLDRPFYDSMLISHMIDENSSHELEDLAEMYHIDPHANQRKAYIHSVRKHTLWHKIPFSIMEPYACGDAHNTYKLCQRLLPVLAKQELTSLYPIEAHYSDALMYIELRGVKIDQDFAEEQSDYCTERMWEIQQELGFDPGKTLALANKLFIELKLPILERGLPNKQFPTGRPVMDEPTMQILARKASGTAQKVMNLVLEYRGLQKARSTWYDGWPEKADSQSRIHTTYNQHVTVTTRLSSVDPNMQQIPRDVEQSPVKKMLRATPGYELWEFDYCVAPETKILGTNLVWYRADELQVGQAIIGFDETPAIEHNKRGQRLQESKVLSIKKLLQPSYRIKTTKGEVTSSGLHKWMASHQGSAYHTWIQTSQLKVGDKLSWYTSPWETEKTYEAGWIAGILDGEGWCSGAAVGFGQNDGELTDAMLYELNERGFTTSRSGQGVMGKHYIQGGSTAAMRLLGTVRPWRLLGKSQNLWEGRRTWGKLNKPAEILEIEYLGDMPVIAVGTSTKTFIANGFLSHNSQIEYRLAGVLSNDPVILEAYRSGSDMHYSTGLRLNTDRQSAKTINFTLIYEAGPGTLAATMGVNLNTARPVWEGYHHTYWVMFAYAARVNATAAQRGYIKLWDGRRRRFRHHFETKKAWNSLVQGGAASIVKHSIVAIHQDKSIKSKMVGQVHDSLWFEIPVGMYEEESAKIKYHMEWPSRDARFKIPFPVDAKRLA